MDFDDGPEESEFRSTFRQWLREHMPSDPPRNHDEQLNTFMRQWQRELYEGGWIGVSWPQEWGGRGLSLLHEAILSEELGAAGAPEGFWMDHLGRAVLAFGTDDQKARFLPPLVSGEVQWCQGFSEPEAGSDLASLRTRAVRSGTSYVVTGQKIWTSRAQWADWCFLLVRTQADGPKHEGISCIMVDMKSPRIKIQPVKQIWGTAEFNQVFFDDVEVPVSNLIGQEHHGWQVITSALAIGRSTSDIGALARFRRALQELEAVARHGNLSLSSSVELQLQRAYVYLQAGRLRVLGNVTLRSQGVPPGPETSIDKLLMIRVNQLLGALELELLSMAPLLGNDSESLYRYLYSRARSVYGGTEQIQRNIVAQRLLKLPR